jgi:hypothetical protein
MERLAFKKADSFGSFLLKKRTLFTVFEMNYPATSSRVSKIKTLNTPRGGELDPCPPLAGLTTCC